ncbi:hypothetical protein B0T14DRAFT_514669 [Immersiella caudata]|uniref:Zn(2)-C6 fungal-type domain-containing protein n=1 Tax=Immersiella caudata TaxID=314043 RepID=A0AA39WWE3_9PEZI|nr:hypothetical protein B0T14DRAFT_514669 [Immersiella caudata]
MSTSPENAPTGSSGATDHSDPAVVEPLACTSCRSRKLKCDRRKPICTRCAKVRGECIYPESRRKPAFKRRNVKELEERLAQVEGFLKNAGKPARAASFGTSSGGAGDLPSVALATGTGVDSELDDLFFTSNYDEPPQNPNPPPTFPSKQNQFSSPSSDSPGSDDQPGGELFGLGRFESLPPHEMIEDLHAIYFETQQSFIPLIHRARYTQAFYATAPHVRPPMALQYAIWAIAANGHEKYSRYYDIFYRRARQYLENDELKGYGEHFVTLAHAQAWALVGTNEARTMHFTKAAMSSARCVRLVEMMGFHRLDDPSKDDNPMAWITDPPKDLIELEERRRVFWGVFCMDAHATISTGWPTLVDLSQVTTHLPCTEESFNSGTPEKTATLKAVLGGFQYSTFAATVVTCHIFTQLLKHVHRPRPDDSPEDYAGGKYWKRHRELDNTLSSSFMFLPERFRLPKYCRDPVAIYQNLNLHASVICLHNSACDKVDKHKLPDHIKQASRMRCLTSAYEIVNIMKMTSNVTTRYKTPLVALSLYCAASVFIAQEKENPEKGDKESLAFLVSCMEAISRQHVITRAYLNHLILDMHHSGIDALVSFLNTCKVHSACGYNIPLLARSSASFGSQPQPPLPLSRPHPPLGPNGKCGFDHGPEKTGCPSAAEKIVNHFGDTDAPGSKRKRTSGPSSTGKSPPQGGVPHQFRVDNLFQQKVPSKIQSHTSKLGLGCGDPDMWASIVGGGRPVRLPHRSSTPLSSDNNDGKTTAPAPGAQEALLRFAMTGSAEFLFERTVAPAELLTTATAPAPARNEPDPASADIMEDTGNFFESMDGQWDNLVDPDLFSQMTTTMLANGGSNNQEGLGASQDGSDPWSQLLSSATDGWDGAAAAAERGGGE